MESVRHQDTVSITVTMSETEFTRLRDETQLLRQASSLTINEIPVLRVLGESVSFAQTKDWDA